MREQSPAVIASKNAFFIDCEKGETALTCFE